MYKILIGSIVPRPIAWVSTVGANGVSNIAPFSFFNCFGVDPPMVGFAPAYKSIAERDGTLVREPKDTLRNILDSGDFVVNIVSMQLAALMNASSAEYSPQESEFDQLGIESAGCVLVKPPRAASALVSFECQLIEYIQHGNNNLVLGEILCMHIDDSVIDEKGHIRSQVLQAVGRMAGNWYTSTNDGNFVLKRP